MSSSLRDATEHTVQSLTDLVGDALHHLELPHVDLGKVTRRHRSSRSPTLFAFLGAAALVVLFVAMRRRQAGATADDIAEG